MICLSVGRDRFAGRTDHPFPVQIFLSSAIMMQIVIDKVEYAYELNKSKLPTDGDHASCVMDLKGRRYMDGERVIEMLLIYRKMPQSYASYIPCPIGLYGLS